MDGGTWWATVHRVTRSWTRLSDFTLFYKMFYLASNAQGKTHIFVFFLLGLKYMSLFLISIQVIH